jgi:hypothetical protein
MITMIPVAERRFGQDAGGIRDYPIVDTLVTLQQLQPSVKTKVGLPRLTL